MVLQSRRTVQYDVAKRGEERREMPKASADTAAHSAGGPGYEGRFDAVGDYTVAFERFSDGGDMALLFRGLPDDRCQCPHWGIVVRGRLTFSYADGQDVVEAGEAYYAPPGHTPAADPDTETIEFSPTAALHETMGVITKNAEALRAGA
jgi:hypothetical protein